MVCSVSESGLVKDLVGLGLLGSSSLIRVYPKGARINSSNYNPMYFVFFCLVLRCFVLFSFVLLFIYWI